MASSDIDQKYLAHIASMTSATHPDLAAPFYSVLGLSAMLSTRVNKAKKMRRLDLSRDTPSLIHYQHIIWLVREGLEILENQILPHTMNGKLGAEATVLAAKLRASFYHLLSIFHNEPPVSQVPPPRSSSRGETASGVLGVSHRHNNSKSSIVSEIFSPKANQGKSKNGITSRTPTLRDPVASATSDASFITNPYANNRSGSAVSSPAPPPGLGGHAVAPRPSAFLFPPMNFLPITETHFVSADRAATTLLPGSHPLRLSAAVEHCVFVWDCLHDFQYARRLARQTIRAVYHAKEGMDDDDFEEAAKMVDQLGKIMKRRSWDGAVRPEIQDEMPGTQMGLLAQNHSRIEEKFRKNDPTRDNSPEQEYEKPSGGFRPRAHADERSCKQRAFQFFRSFSCKRRSPMNTQVQQVRNKSDTTLTRSLKSTRPLGPEPVDGQRDVPDRLLRDVYNAHSATEWDRHDVKSFRMRMTGGVIPRLSTPSLAPRAITPEASSPAWHAARVDTEKANEVPEGEVTDNHERSSPPSSPSPARLRPSIDLDKPLPLTPLLLSSPPARPCPAPIDVDKANEATKSEVVDDYQWSPRIPRKSNHMLRNRGNYARFRNEAFPPIDGAQYQGNPIIWLCPTSIMLATGEVKIVEQLRYVNLATVNDRERYNAALKKRDEELIERANKQAYEDAVALGRLKCEKLTAKGAVELGKRKCEKLTAQWASLWAHEAQNNAQKHM